MTADWSGLVFDGDGRLVDLNAAAEVVTYGPPPPVRWLPASDLPAVFGRRACHMKASGPVYDLRCASEVYESNGGLYVNVTLEAQWYAWLDLDQGSRPELIPRATAMSARHVWIEVVETAPEGPASERQSP